MQKASSPPLDPKSRAAAGKPWEGGETAQVDDQPKNTGAVALAAPPGAGKAPAPPSSQDPGD